MSHREDDDRPITGWHDILELAAEAGLEPVGPTLQSGLNFAAAFQPAGLKSLQSANNANAITNSSKGGNKKSEALRPAKAAAIEDEEDEITAAEEAHRNNMLLKTFLTMNELTA